jgi:hypothetical protein
MKPVHVFALLVSGALGGALVMRWVHPGKPTIRIEATQARPPATAPIASAKVPATLPAPEPAAEAAPIDAKSAVVDAKPEVRAEVKAEPKPATPEVRAEVKAEPKPAKPSPMPPLAKPPVRRETAKLYPFHNVPPLAPEPVIPSTVEYGSPTPTPPPVSFDPHPEPAVPDPGPVLPEATAVPVPQPHQVTLNAGFILPVRLVDGLSSARNVPGDTFLATVARELVAGGFVIAERGARVEGRVVAVDRARARSAALALELTRLYTSDGQTVVIQTEGFFKHANSGDMSNADKIGGGALIGALIGALAGGGKGAAIGAGIGGGVGVGDLLLIRRPAEMASETLVTFRLKMPVPLIEHLR